MADGMLWSLSASRLRLLPDACKLFWMSYDCRCVYSGEDRRSIDVVAML